MPRTAAKSATRGSSSLASMWSTRPNRSPRQHRQVSSAQVISARPKQVRASPVAGGGSRIVTTSRSCIRLLMDAMALALGCELHGERVARRPGNENRDLARPFILRPCRLGAAGFGAIRRNLLAVETDDVHRTLDAMELEAITAPGDALEGAVTAFGAHHEPGPRAGLAEAEMGALELAALIRNAEPVVFIQRKFAGPGVAGEVGRSKAVDVHGQQIERLFPGILHRWSERDHSARTHVGRNAIERDRRALDFSAALNRRLLVEQVVPRALGQVELAVPLVVEQRRNQDVVAHEKLIVDAKAGRILRFLQLHGAQDRHAGSVRLLVKRIEIGNEAVAQIQERTCCALDRLAVGIGLMVALTVRPHEGVERRRGEPARIKRIA